MELVSGAAGGGRTHTMSPSRDFESRASASSTTAAKNKNDLKTFAICNEIWHNINMNFDCLNIITQIIYKCKRFY